MAAEFEVQFSRGVILKDRAFTGGPRDLPKQGYCAGRSLAPPETRLRSGTPDEGAEKLLLPHDAASAAQSRDSFCIRAAPLKRCPDTKLTAQREAAPFQNRAAV